MNETFGLTRNEDSPFERSVEISVASELQSSADSQAEVSQNLITARFLAFDSDEGPAEQERSETSILSKQKHQH